MLFRLLVASLLIGCGNTVVVVDRDDAGGASATGTSTGVATGGAGGDPDVGGFGGFGGFPEVDEPLVETDYGALPNGSTFVANIPPGVLGFTAIAETDSSFQTISFSQIVAPSGAAVVQNGGIAGTLLGYEWPGITTAGVPQSDAPDAMPVASGPWSISLGGSAATADVSVWHRETADGEFHGGVIDINVFVVPGLASEQYIADSINTAFGNWAGLGIGTLSFLPLDPEFAFIEDSNFFEGLRSTKGAPGQPALNILAVGGFGGSLEGAAGVSPGAPAQHLYDGTNQSGVYWQVLQDPFFDVVILRHETGHSAGLLHTSEFEAGFFDALNDTPQCPDVWGLLDDCPDSDNIMFPTGGNGVLFLSPKQQAVIHGSTLYRASYSAGAPPVPPLDGSGQEIAAPSADHAHAPNDPALHVAMAMPTRPAARSAAWASGLSDAAVENIMSLWCPAVGQGVAGLGGIPRAEFPTALRAAMGDDIDRLLQLGAHSTAPEFVRMRALLAAGGSAISPTQRKTLESIAQRGDLPRLVRLGALRGLVGASALDARATAQSLLYESDPILAAAAARIVRAGAP